MSAPARGAAWFSPGRIKALLLGAGALLFALLLRSLGTKAVLLSLETVWPVLPVLLLIEGFAKLANALGLRRAMKPAGRRVALPRLLRLTVEADAVNYLVPAASLGGNALLVRGLMWESSLTDGVVAVATAGSAQAIAQFLLVLAGSTLALTATPVPARLRPAVWAVAGLSAVIVGGLFVILRTGAFVFVSAVLRRLHIGAGYLRDRARQVAEMDAHLRDILRRRPLDLAMSVFYFACGWGVSAAEVFVVLWRLGVAFDWRQAMAIHALAVFIDGIVFFMPAKAGTQEAGKVLAFTAVGLTGAAGLTFGLMRRVRETAWALLGYALIAGDGRQGSAIVSGPTSTSPARPAGTVKRTGRPG